MPNFNRVILAGNIVRDPELRYVSSGTAVCEITLAINRKFKGSDGQMRDDTSFIDVVFWGRNGENINQYLKKGRPILVEGRLNQETWEDKTSGQKRSKVNVVGDKFEFIDSKGSGGDNGSYSAPSHQAQQASSPAAPAAQAPPQQAPQATPAAPKFDDNFDVQGDEIPF